jgi:hypothetical protein
MFLMAAKALALRGEAAHIMATSGSTTSFKTRLPADATCRFSAAQPAAQQKRKQHSISFALYASSTRSRLPFKSERNRALTPGVPARSTNRRQLPLIVPGTSRVNSKAGYHCPVERQSSFGAVPGTKEVRPHVLALALAMPCAGEHRSDLPVQLTERRNGSQKVPCWSGPDS